MAEGARLELASGFPRRISSAVPYQLDYPSNGDSKSHRPCSVVKQAERKLECFGSLAPPGDYFAASITPQARRAPELPDGL